MISDAVGCFWFHKEILHLVEVMLDILSLLSIVYRILPNKGAGRSNKTISNSLEGKLTFSAFQRWFRIENRTIIKETT